jgi:hypothetical protein
MLDWLSILIGVAVFVAVVALTGARPKGARPVGRTHLMTGARVALVVLVALVAWAVWAR